MEYNVFQDRLPLIAVDNLKGWSLYKFEDVLIDDTKNACKIKKEEYLEIGKYPIIDQGQTSIAGYTNNYEGIYQTNDVIIFGDHTRIIKYIDFSIFLGADGVKLLKSKLGNLKVNMKYIYYFLKTVELPSDGYSRHFKYLKQVIIPVPNISIQDKIVQILDKAQELVDKRKEQIEACDELIKSLFYDMFGDDRVNDRNWKVKKWEEVFNTTTGKLDANAMNETGLYPFFTCSKEIFKINEYAFDCEALLLAGNNATANYDVKYYNGKFNAYQRTYVLTIVNHKYHYKFLKLALENKLQQLKKNSIGSNTKYLTMSILNKNSFICPPIDLQNQFAEQVQKIEQQKLLMQQSLTELENNFNSLMQRAFKGELF